VKQIVAAEFNGEQPELKDVTCHLERSVAFRHLNDFFGITNLLWGGG